MARADGDLFSVPRLTISDADRGERLEKLLGGGAARVAARDPLASCRAHGAAPASP